MPVTVKHYFYIYIILFYKLLSFFFIPSLIALPTHCLPIMDGISNESVLRKQSFLERCSRRTSFLRKVDVPVNHNKQRKHRFSRKVDVPVNHNKRRGHRFSGRLMSSSTIKNNEDIVFPEG